MKKILLLLLGTLVTLAGFGQGTQLVKIRECRTCPVLWQATAIRNVTTYPLTTAGQNAFEAAALNGAFDLTTADGAVLPAGTKPGRVAPSVPTSGTMVTGVTWLTGVRYSLTSANLLTIEAAGETVLLRFERQDGQSMTGGNSDGAVLNSTDYFGAGSNPDQGSYDKQWRGSFQPAVAGVPLKITFKRASSGVIVAYNFTPVSGANRLVLAGSSSSPSSTAAFAIAGVTTVSCQTATVTQRTLTFTPTYTGLNGSPVSFSVVGEISPTTTAGPYAINVYTDNPTLSLKAVQSGRLVSYTYYWLAACNGTVPTTPPTTTTTTTAGGSGQGVWAANSSYVPLAETGNRPGFTLPAYITNGTLRIGITPTAGDVITQVQEGQETSIINNPKFNNNQTEGSLDVGRQLMDAAYGFPDGSQKFRDEGQGGGVEELGEGPYVQGGQSTDQFHNGAAGGSIGFNPVEGGDESYKGTGNSGKQKGSPVITHHVEAASSYSKTQPLLWDLDNQAAQMYIEKWLSFDPSNAKAFRMHRRWSFFRTDAFTSEYPTPKDQEAPCAYLTPDFNRYFVCYGQPYTNVGLHEHTIDGSTQQQPVYSTEGAIYAYSSQRNKWVALYAPYGQFSAGVFNFPFGGQPSSTSPDSFEAGYINVKYSMSLDKNGVYDFDAAMCIGNSLSEVRNWVYSQPRMSGLPEYKFNSKSRLLWHTHHAQDQLESNITDGIVVTPIAKRRTAYGKDMQLKSPHVWVNGRVVKHIYLKAGITSHNGNMVLVWKKIGDNNEYRHNFSVTPNGSVQVYDIDLSNDGNWNNQDIMQFRIQHDGDAQSGETYNVKWIGWKNLD